MGVATSLVPASQHGAYALTFCVSLRLFTTSLCRLICNGQQAAWRWVCRRSAGDCFGNSLCDLQDSPPPTCTSQLLKRIRLSRLPVTHGVFPQLHYGLSALRSTREAPHGVSLQSSGALATAVVHAPGGRGGQTYLLTALHPQRQDARPVGRNF